MILGIKDERELDYYCSFQGKLGAFNYFAVVENICLKCLYATFCMEGDGKSASLRSTVIENSKGRLGLYGAHQSEELGFTVTFRRKAE